MNEQENLDSLQWGYQQELQEQMEADRINQIIFQVGTLLEELKERLNRESA